MTSVTPVSGSSSQSALDIYLQQLATADAAQKSASSYNALSSEKAGASNPLLGTVTQKNTNQSYSKDFYVPLVLSAPGTAPSPAIVSLITQGNMSDMLVNALTSMSQLLSEYTDQINIMTKLPQEFIASMSSLFTKTAEAIANKQYSQAQLYIQQVRESANAQGKAAAISGGVEIGVGVGLGILAGLAIFGAVFTGGATLLVAGAIIGGLATGAGAVASILNGSVKLAAGLALSNQAKTTADVQNLINSFSNQLNFGVFGLVAGTSAKAAEEAQRSQLIFTCVTLALSLGTASLQLGAAKAVEVGAVAATKGILQNAAKIIFDSGRNLIHLNNIIMLSGLIAQTASVGKSDANANGSMSLAQSASMGALGFVVFLVMQGMDAAGKKTEANGKTYEENNSWYVYVKMSVQAVLMVGAALGTAVASSRISSNFQTQGLTGSFPVLNPVAAAKLGSVSNQKAFTSMTHLQVSQYSSVAQNVNMANVNVGSGAQGYISGTKNADAAVNQAHAALTSKEMMFVKTILDSIEALVATESKNANMVLQNASKVYGAVIEAAMQVIKSQMSAQQGMVE